MSISIYPDPTSPELKMCNTAHSFCSDKLFLYVQYMCYLVSRWSMKSLEYDKYEIYKLKIEYITIWCTVLYLFYSILVRSSTLTPSYCKTISVYFIWLHKYSCSDVGIMWYMTSCPLPTGSNLTLFSIRHFRTNLVYVWIIPLKTLTITFISGYVVTCSVKYSFEHDFWRLNGAVTPSREPFRKKRFVRHSSAR